MERFIQFNDEQIDTMLLMELDDLVKTLIKQKEYSVEFRPHSYLDRKEKKVYVSHFWNHRPFTVMKNGLKTDVFLRAMGNFTHTDVKDLYEFEKQCQSLQFQSFATQVFTLVEDMRIEELCKRERPGTKKAFAVRQEIYLQYFQSQLETNIVKSIHTDALFNVIYLMLFSKSPLLEIPSISESIDLVIPFIRSQLSTCYDAKATSEVVKHCLELMAVLEEVLQKDMLNEYFHLPKVTSQEESKAELLSNIRRVDPLVNDDISKEDHSNKDTFKEEMKTWHRETKESGDHFLQYELEQGTKTNLFSENGRDEKDNNGAWFTLQGSKQQTSNNQYNEMEPTSLRTNYNQNEFKYGKANQHAIPIFLQPHMPTAEDILQYKEKVHKIEIYEKKLTKMIQKTLEQKRTWRREHLHYGRLSKKLTRYFTEERPRLFYKKEANAKEIDAVFTLLVDCSASMFDKMEETTLGICLFHEALKAVKVRHEIIGFWEDANEATKTEQPNYFNEMITFQTSLQKNKGPEIMQLEPAEDNRDGFAIRLMSERLESCHERQKFLFIFSDGEPAAFGYEQNGVLDTHEAVLEARKKGIEVFNVFLSNQEITEQQRLLLQHIYGHYSILVPNVSQLPEVLFPLLRKLLYRSI